MRLDAHPDAQRTVIAVADASTLVLDDGSEVRLAGILSPGPTDAPFGVTSWPPRSDAYAALSALVLGRRVVVTATGAPHDRYGRRTAHVDVEQRDGAPVWVQGQLLARGHARADLGEGMPEPCAAALLTVERTAREAAAGLWSHAAYRVRAAYRTRELMRLQSTYQIVAGRVRSVTEIKGGLVLNFGHDWRSDFSVGLRTAGRGTRGHGSDGPPPSGGPRPEPDTTPTGGAASASRRASTAAPRPWDHAALASRLRALEGREVLVRGWIERRYGPYIELTHPADIEERGDGIARAAPATRGDVADPRGAAADRPTRVP